MASNNDDKYLKRCLDAAITAVQETLDKLRSQPVKQQGFKLNAGTDTNLHTFTLDKDEEKLVGKLQRTLESLFEKYLPSLPQNQRKYLLDILHEYTYDYKKQTFKNSLNFGILPTFLKDLECTLASLDAFKAAWDGDIPAVKKFIQKYPSFKNKPGLFGTTLLYSAARNNNADLVDFLISTAGCSVNAQNQQHIEKALLATAIKADNFTASPTSGSTALHVACYYGHLDMVKYLVKHGADYFIENHARETPIMNAKSHPKILDYFRQILVLGYSTTSSSFPQKTILEEIEDRQQPVVDCVWEYKPLPDQKWYPFTKDEADKLQQSLHVNPNQPFKLELYFQVRGGIYSVSISQFLRSSKDQDPKRNRAWVRCRGSSLLNFDCYSLWQIMLVEHPKPVDSFPSLKPFDIPTIYSSTFKIQLNAWYNCDEKLNAQLDETMNTRRKYISLNVDSISSDQLNFNLEEFTFTNNKKTISGFIRWIPKMISNNQRNKDKITNIDNFQTFAGLDPIPLTVARLKQATHIGHKTATTADEKMNEALNEDDSLLRSNSNGLDDDDDDGDDNDDSFGNHNRAFALPNAGTWCLTDLASNDNGPDPHRKRTSSESTDDSISVSPDDYFNEAAAKFHPQQRVSLIQKTNSDANLQAAKAMNAELEKEKRNLQARLDAERAKVEELSNLNVKRTTEQENRLAELRQHHEHLKQQQRKMQERETKLKQIENGIKTMDYNDIQSEVINDFIVPKFELMLNYLRKLNHNLDEYFVDRIPQMSFQAQNQTYTILLTGFRTHHDAFKAILERIWNLLNVTQSAKEYYQRFVGKILKTITKKTLPEVQRKTHNWRLYVTLFVQMLEDKYTEHIKLFTEYIGKQSKQLVEQCILGTLNKPWLELQKQTNDFKQQNPFVNHIEALKQQALDEFIRQNISTQRLKLGTKPSPKSVAIVQDFIEKVKTVLKTNKMYIGHEVQHFNLIPALLERLMIYYCCFAIQLPLYESSKELLDKIEKNAVTTISTSTGSGKSTLLPALLIAEGYDKVIVTQPRRLPCQLISTRVNETMTIDGGSPSEKLTGWAVSGREENPKAKIIFLTDGLLKERLLYDENFITNNTRLNKSVVFFIDEVHERSVNIDLCLALLARLLTIQPELKSKMKVIISSATLDSSVPTLFRQIPQVGFAQFTMPQMGTLHPVTKVPRPNKNILDVVQELYKKRRRDEQILCFVNSVADVHQNCRLLSEISGGAIVAYPLVQSQRPSDQQLYLKHGSVFFSTTVAETSLTFPSLKYVIDTGRINIPVHDFNTKQTVLKEVRAAESTIKQRLGRLGRTQPGEYYSLYDFKVEDKPYPTPQICQTELTSIEFSLRKSPLGKGLNYMKTFLPDKPSQNAMDVTIKELKDQRIVEITSKDQLTSHGQALAKLPEFGSLAMSKAVLAALQQYNCGHDLICLSAILGVFNTTNALKPLPPAFKSSDGDFMTLLNIMKTALSIKQSVQSEQFQLERICRAKGLTSIKHILQQALRRYRNLEKTFNLLDEFREQAQTQSGNWESIAKALLAGYPDNIFVSMVELKGRIHRYMRYNDENDIAVLDLQSTLTRPLKEEPVPLVLARDIRRSTAVRATAVLSFVGRIETAWMENSVQRQIKLDAEEEKFLNNNSRYSNAQSTFSNRISMQLRNQTLSLNGPSGVVLDAELHLRQQMINVVKFLLTDLNPPNTKLHANFSRNMDSIMRMPNLFSPMMWRWKAEKQVKIYVNSNTSTKRCEITVKGRDSDIQKVKDEFTAFVSWLNGCTVIRHPDAGMPPRLIRPQHRKACLEIEERISHITDSKRTLVSLHNDLKGANATRETRMEVVAWIAVCKFGCKLEGGFVRDWVVGHYISRPANPPANPKDWIEYVKNIPGLNKEVVPCDLDCHLPSTMYFNVDKFQDELHKFDIACKVYPDKWRYVLLIDEDAPTGPFTMDLIEPHVALTQDRIDFDVNNLSLEKDYTHELGMRIDIEQKPYLHQLETVIEHIKNKCFQVMRPIDHQVAPRIDKMVNVRKWTQTGKPFSVVPEPHAQCHSMLVPLPYTSTLYQEVSQQIKRIGASVQIDSIEQVKNPFLEDAYEAMKKLIAKQCAGSDPNERELFHGTKGEGINGIVEDGFDDRFFVSTGNWGHGAYFADDPKKSHDYTQPDPTDKTHVMFYNKVLLGKESVQTEVNKTLNAAPKDHHSVRGKVPPQLPHTEYIIYRYGQALPYLKVVYKV